MGQGGIPSSAGSSVKNEAQTQHAGTERGGRIGVTQAFPVEGQEFNSQSNQNNKLYQINTPCFLASCSVVLG